MKDRLGFGAWINSPTRNPTQNLFTRFVKQPYTGLPDTLRDIREKFDEFGKKVLRTHLSEYLED